MPPIKKNAPKTKPAAAKKAAGSKKVSQQSVLAGMLFVLVRRPSGDPETMAIRGPADSAAAACQMTARTVLFEPYDLTGLKPCSGKPICRFR